MPALSKVLKRYSAWNWKALTSMTAQLYFSFQEDV